MVSDCLYQECFGVGAMLAIPLADKKRILGCVALHWRASPGKVTSQELAILSGIATQVGITLENVADVIPAGADGVAVISAILSSGDIKKTTGEMIKKLQDSAAAC